MNSHEMASTHDARVLEFPRTRSDMDRHRSRESTAGVTDVFRAIADPTRRTLLELLVQGERPVKELAEPFSISRPAVSQHLRILRDADLVTERRVGQERWYQLKPEQLHNVRIWLERYEQFWQEPN